MEPYIYTEARQTYDTGVAFFRPLYYDWSEAEQAYASKGEYLFGDGMIVAPITAPVNAESQLASQSVWIPPGEWIEMPTGKHFTGPIQIDRKFSISQIPIYIRAGTVMPMQPDMEYTGEKPVDPLILNVQPLVDGQTSSYTLYEDASASEAYKHGVFARTKLSASQKGDDLEIEVAPVQGHYPGMPLRRGFELKLPNDWPPESVTLNGRPLPFERQAGRPGWRYEGNTLTTIITVTKTSVAQDIKIHIRRPAGSIARRDLLDGFAGAMARFRNAYDTLNETKAGSPDPLTIAMQTGDRLSYHPETAQAEIAQRKQASARAIDSIQTMLTEFEASDGHGNGTSGKSMSPKETPEQRAHHQLLLRRALIQAQDAETN
jgi:alpha-glucosidase